MQIRLEQTTAELNIEGAPFLLSFFFFRYHHLQDYCSVVQAVDTAGITPWRAYSCSPGRCCSIRLLYHQFCLQRLRRPRCPQLGLYKGFVRPFSLFVRLFAPHHYDLLYLTLHRSYPLSPCDVFLYHYAPRYLRSYSFKRYTDAYISFAGIKSCHEGQIRLAQPPFPRHRPIGPN